jgi:hypothetical protein
MKTYLELGRVSNLPTVLTNFLAGAALANALAIDVRAVVGLIAMGLFYEAGMFLNDAFDRDIDARERPDRPIPSGRISAKAVFIMGFGMMAAALILLSLVGLLAPDGTGLLAPAWAVALGAAIVVYNRWHKGNPVSPFFMGLCRMLVYLTAAATMTSEFSTAVLAGALVALAYLIGLTYVAKQEHLATFSGGWPLLFLAAPFVWLGPEVLHTPSGMAIFAGFLVWVLYALSFLFRPGPGHVPKAVISLIAGISLLDGLLVVSAGYPMLAWTCVGGFVLTLAGQRVVSGT